MASSRSRIFTILLLAGSLWGWGFGHSEKGAAASPDQICPILSGSTVPDVNFRTLEGKDLSLKQAVSQKPTLLIFYRGGW